MSADHHSINETEQVFSEKIDLGLTMPDHLDLRQFLNFDRILRLHPNWFVTELNREGESFTADIKDYVTDQTSSLSGRILFGTNNNQILSIELTGTVEIGIEFFIMHGSLCVQTRSHGEIEGSDPIVLWIRSIREYIRLYVKKTPITLFFRVLMNRMVLQMNPSQRKICMMLAKITAIEILVIIFILVGYTIFVL